MTSSAYTPEQLEEISTRLVDLQQCLTSKIISIELRLSRSAANQLLKDFLEKSDNKGDFCVARYVRSKENGRTVIKLDTARVSTPYDPPPNAGPIYSITHLRSSTTSLKTLPRKAQQFTSTSLTDLLSTDVNTALDSTLRCVEIKPKVEIERRDVGSVRGKRVASLPPTGGANVVVKKEVKQNLGGGDRRKNTTAASFFAARGGGAKKKEIKKEGVKKEEVKKKQVSNRRVIDDDESDEEMEERTNAEVKKKPTKSQDDDKSEEEGSQENKSTKLKKKPTKKRKTKSEKEEEHAHKLQNYGNADDFIGDEDEDDEYLAQEAERRKRNALAARKEVREKAEDELAVRRNKSTFRENQRRRAVPRSEDDGEEMDVDMGDEEEDEKKGKETVYGEMDSFLQRCKDSQEESLQKDSQSQSRPGKKRRKVLKEVTSMGADGYLHTETVTEYEEVSDSEVQEEEKKESSRDGFGRGSTMPKKKSGGAKKAAGPGQKKNMKQTGLMGFFAPKKK